MMTLLAESYESAVVDKKQEIVMQTDSAFMCVLLTYPVFLLQELARQVLSAMRAIAGNDDVKDAVVNAGGVQLIVIAMNRHMSNSAVS